MSSRCSLRACRPRIHHYPVALACGVRLTHELVLLHRATAALRVCMTET
jgi:hypothetical protein